MFSDDISIMMCACFTYSVVVVFLSVVAAFQDSPPNLKKKVYQGFNSTTNYCGNDKLGPTCRDFRIWTQFLRRYVYFRVIRFTLTLLYACPLHDLLHTHMEGTARRFE